jgi:polysaccharide deacetylase family protein (PEP-CTERM system associated)
MLNILSFDVEDWFHLLDAPSTANTCDWEFLPQIVEPYTHLILEILSRFNVRATFFVVGWVARRHPQLVRDIVDLGHEIASHSYWHRPINRMNRQEFAKDLYKSVDILEQLTGKKVMGFRAPGFTLDVDTEWAFEVLLEQGLKYDASLIPYRPQSFSCPPHIHSRKTPGGQSLFEIPVSALPLGKLSIPYCGGGYLRLIPQTLLSLLMQRQNRLGLPNVVYLHPRDFAIDCPRTKLSPLRRFRTYHGIDSTQSKLEFMLQNFRWDCCASVLGLIPQYEMIGSPILRSAY